MSVQSKYVPLTCTGHSRPVTHLAFSTIFDDGGYLILSTCKDGNPMLRDGITGDWIGTFLGHKGATWAAAFNRDASMVVTASADFTAKIWTTATGQPLLTLAHNHIVRSGAFAPDASARCATAGNEKTVRVWDIGRGDGVVAAEWAAADRTVRSLLWTDENALITCSEDRALRWWDPRAPAAPVHTVDLPGVAGQVEVRDGAVVACAGRSVLLFDARTREPVHRLDLAYDVSSAAVNTARTKVVTGSTADTWVRVHDYASGAEIDLFRGHHGPVHSVDFSPDSQIIASGSEDGTVRLWKSEPGPYGLWK
ncbi:WD40-repeat-containing domain protein [Dipodascopsis tothii]|uniref:WD40-repeat-containing domain protein n=1 Tax=Dipodascopsis tothii TaxID=44089 RepID=UPI0034CE4584